MMAYLVETSILGRLANPADAEYQAASRAILSLHNSGESLHTAPQCLIEFRNVATRPVQANGLGLSTLHAETIADGFEIEFALLEETPAIFPAWKSLVRSAGILGKQVHDGRLVAFIRAMIGDHATAAAEIGIQVHRDHHARAERAGR